MDHAGSKIKIPNRLYISKEQIQKPSKKIQKLPRADINSDHNIVVLDTNLSLKRKKNNQSTNNKEIRRYFNKRVNDVLQETKTIRNQNIVEEEWKQFRDTMINAAEKYIKYTKETAIKPWINSKYIDLIEKMKNIQKCK